MVFYGPARTALTNRSPCPVDESPGRPLASTRETFRQRLQLPGVYRILGGEYHPRLDAKAADEGFSGGIEGLRSCPWVHDWLTRSQSRSASLHEVRGEEDGLAFVAEGAQRGSPHRPPGPAGRGPWIARRETPAPGRFTKASAMKSRCFLAPPDSLTKGRLEPFT